MIYRTSILVHLATILILACKLISSFQSFASFEMPSVRKGKYSLLTIAQRVLILDKLKKGTSATLISKEFGIAKSTVSLIKKNELKIRSAFGASSALSNRKKQRKSNFPRTESALHKWFVKQRDQNVPINGNILIEKAKYYCTKFDEGNFKASTGWLDRFKRRHGIRLLAICGEKLSADVPAIAPFVDQLASKIAEMGITKQQIYNADESGLYWQLLPNKTFVHLGEKSAPGFKISKQRVTVLACANATGEHKLTPLVIGKSKKPRCFRNWNNPLLYDNSSSAWMTANIFKDWFFKHFVPTVKTMPQFIRFNPNCTNSFNTGGTILPRKQFATNCASSH